VYRNCHPSWYELSITISFDITSSNLQLSHTSDLITTPLNFFIPWSSSSNVAASTVGVSASVFWLNSLPDYLGPFEPYFAGIGSEVREIVTSAQETWVRLAIGSRPTNRAFAILLGYVEISVAFGVYLHIMTVGSTRTAGTAVRNIIKQQLLVIKVCQCVYQRSLMVK